MDEEIFERFTIDSDDKAEWALGKIKEAQEERDRLLDLVNMKRLELDKREQEILHRYDSDTNYIRFLLEQYMATVKVKSTKTQDSYQLLSGKLVRKHAGVEFKRDNEKLATWLKDNGYVGLIKETIEPRWGDLKKQLCAENGVVTIASTGEVVDGITATETPETFDIKFN